MKTIVALSLAILSLFAKPPVVEASEFNPIAKHSSSDCAKNYDFAGTFIRAAYSASTESYIMSQLVLHADGTAYYYQSYAFDLFVTEGSFIPYVGTWKKQGKHIYVTSYSTNFDPVTLPPNDIHDIAPTEWLRRVEKLKIVDCDTLTSEQRTIYTIPLDLDPLENQGNLEGNSCNEFTWKRAQVRKGDLAPCES